MTDFSTTMHRAADWRAWGPAVLEAALWGVLLVNGARLAWLLLVSPTPPETVPMPSTTFTATGYPDRDPFYPAADASVDAAPASLAGYTLHGVRHADGGAGAIIAGPEGRQHAYRTGDALAAGVTLQAVGATHVVLAASGRRHRLDLPQAGAMAAATDRARDERPAPAPAAAPAPAPAPATPGLRVDDHPALRLAGLEAGDVLVAVDGRPATAAWLASVARDGGTSGATLTVRRGGRTLTLVVGPLLR